MAIGTYVSVGYSGVGVFGYISLLGTLFLLLPFSDLGLGAAVINAVAERDDDGAISHAARDAVRRSLVILSGVGVLIIGVAGALSLLGVWPTLLGIPLPLANSTNSAAFAVFVVVGVSVPLGLGQRLLVSINLTHWGTALAAAGPVIALGVIAALITFNAPPLFLAIATPFGILVSAIVATIVAFRRLGWSLRTLASSKLDPSERRIRIWASAAPMMVIMIGAPLALQTHRLILAHVGTPEQLAQYAIGAQFYAPALSIATTGALAMWPQFATDRASQRGRWLLSLVVMAIVGLLGAGSLGILLDPVSALVTSGQVQIPIGLAIAFAALLFVMAVHQPSAMLLTTSRALRFQAYCMGALAIVSVPIGVALAPTLGAAGPVWATAIAVAGTSLIPCIAYARFVILRR